MASRRPGARAGDEDLRATRLLDAQGQAARLFAAIGPRGIIAPGVREAEASDAIRDLAAEMFGVSRHWHKRIVRAGPNTLQPYRHNPPDRVIAADDMGSSRNCWTSARDRPRPAGRVSPRAGPGPPPGR